MTPKPFSLLDACHVSEESGATMKKKKKKKKKKKMLPFFFNKKKRGLAAEKRREKAENLRKRGWEIKNNKLRSRPIPYKKKKQKKKNKKKHKKNRPYMSDPHRKNPDNHVRHY